MPSNLEQEMISVCQNCQKGVETESKVTDPYEEHVVGYTRGWNEALRKAGESLYEKIGTDSYNARCIIHDLKIITEQPKEASHAN